MEQNAVFTSTSVHYDDETPYIETRARILRSPDGSLPEGRVMVFKTPILPPGASEEEIRACSTMEIVDDYHREDPFHCEECAKLGLGPHGWLKQLETGSVGGRARRLGRNAPCWCGSGKKYKKCCLETDG